MVTNLGGAAQALFGAAVKQPAKAAWHWGAYALELGKVAAGKSQDRGRSQGQALRRSRPGRAARCTSACCRPTPPPARELKPLHRRDFAQRARQGARPPGGVDLRRHDCAQQFAAQPDGAQARRRHRAARACSRARRTWCTTCATTAACPRRSTSRKFEIGRNLCLSPGNVVLQQRGAGTDPVQAARPTRSTSRPLVICPPQVNKFYALDLSPEKSLVKFAAEPGPADLRDQLAQPDQGAARLEHVDLRARRSTKRWTWHARSPAAPMSTCGAPAPAA